MKCNMTRLRICMFLAAFFLIITGSSDRNSVRGEESDAMYTITDLGTLGGDWSYAGHINNRNDIVGISSISNSAQHGFSWVDGFITDLGTPAGYLVSGASSVNDTGQVAGYARGEYQSQFAYIWEDGVWSYLGTLSGLDSSSTSDINNAGLIVGYSFILGPGGGHRAWIYQNGDMTDLGTLGGDRASPAAINEAGQVVGWAETDTPGISHAFIWEDGVMTDLGVLPGEEESSAADLNETGQICGLSSHTSPVYPFSTFKTACLWDSGDIIEIGKLPGYTRNSASSGINNKKQVVGHSSDNGNNPHAFIWEAGVLTDLNDLIPPDSGWELKSAADIDELGQIVGYGEFNNETRAFLLTPANLEILFDNQDPEWMVISGTWHYRFYADAYGSDLYWSGKTTSSPHHTAGFRMDQVVPPGAYDVYIHKFEHPYQGIVATNAPFLVKDKYGTHTVTIDLSTPGNEWIPAGQFEFNTTGFQGIGATTGGANGVVIIDAVKLIRAD